MAYCDYGIWSLIFMNLTKIVLVLILWFHSDWKPSIVFSKTDLTIILIMDINYCYLHY